MVSIYRKSTRIYRSDEQKIKPRLNMGKKEKNPTRQTRKKPN